MTIKVEYHPSTDPVVKIERPSIWIKVLYKGVTYGKQFICSDAEENAIKEMIPMYLQEFLKEVFDRGGDSND